MARSHTDHSYSVYDNEAGELERGEACRPSLSTPPSTQARRERWPSTPLIPSLASASAFTCHRDASTWTGIRWDSSPRDAEAETLRALEQWKTLSIDGWLGADPPWFTLGEELGALLAPLVGAEPEAVVVTGSTTVNQHALTATFYRPHEARRKVVATALDFPSDVYALQSLIHLHGGDPHHDLVLVPSRDGRMIAEEDVIAALGDDVALALLPAVLYRSGQLLDIPLLAAEAQARGIPLGSTARTRSAPCRIASTSGVSIGPSGVPISI